MHASRGDSGLAPGDLVVVRRAAGSALTAAVDSAVRVGGGAWAWGGRRCDDIRIGYTP